MGVQTQGSDFTASWRNSNIGKVGLFIVGLAFLIAFIVMMLQAVTKKFHRELRLKVLFLLFPSILPITPPCPPSAAYLKPRQDVTPAAPAFGWHLAHQIL